MEHFLLNLILKAMASAIEGQTLESSTIFLAHPRYAEYLVFTRT